MIQRMKWLKSGQGNCGNGTEGQPMKWRADEQSNNTNSNNNKRYIAWRIAACKGRKYNTIRWIALHNLSKDLYFTLCVRWLKLKEKPSPHARTSTHTLSCVYVRILYNKIPTHWFPPSLTLSITTQRVWASKRAHETITIERTNERRAISQVPFYLKCFVLVRVYAYAGRIYVFDIANKIASSLRDRFKRSFRFYSLSSPCFFLIFSLSIFALVGIKSDYFIQLNISNSIYSPPKKYYIL